MRISTLLVVFLLTPLASCGGGGGESQAPVADVAPVEKTGAAPSRADVLALVYDNAYSVPSDFFVDARANTPQSFTMHHVLDGSKSYERCTDDFSTAMDWESADNASRAVQGTFVAAFETDRYFEVARELAYGSSIGNVNDMTSPGFARVFKCSNTEREGVDRSKQSGFAGRINARPLTDTTVREFTEYLWQFAFFPTARKKVLDTRTVETSDSIRHTLLLGFAVSGPTCDTIEVVEWSFTSNREHGGVQKDWTVVDSFRARLEGGGPVLCN